jgi:hypothetical protein
MDLRTTHTQRLAKGLGCGATGAARRRLLRLNLEEFTRCRAVFAKETLQSISRRNPHDKR